MHPEFVGKFDLKCSKCGSDKVKFLDPEDEIVSYDEKGSLTESPLYNELVNSDVLLKCSKCDNHASIRFD